MIHRNLQITIILLVLVFTGSNILPDVYSTPVAADMNQPIQESQDNENQEKPFDEKDLMKRSLSLQVHLPDKTDVVVKFIFFHLDHTLEVISPPPETFFT